MAHVHVKWSITVTAVAVASIHLAFPHLAIDGVTALLLVIAVLPWLQSLFKSVELPGGLKVEYRDLLKVEGRAEAVGLLEHREVPLEREYTFQALVETDPNLALAGLRIEIERRLDTLARINGYQGSPRGIGNLLRHLVSRSLLSETERSVLADTVALLNNAVHGAEVSPVAARWALEVGPALLAALDKRLGRTLE